MKKIRIGCYVVGMVQTNFYFLHLEGEKETIVFDPADYGKEIYDELTRQGLEIKAIFLTHGHFDHIMGVKALKEACGAPVYASALEKDLLTDPYLNTSAQCGRSCVVEPDHWLIDGETVTAAGITLRMISTPGHTEGSCCYYIMHDIVESIRTKLYKLPDNTQVYTGHGGSTTIEHEKKYNYFVTV